MVVNTELLSRADGVGHYETEAESPSSTNPGAVKIMFQVACLKKNRSMEAACGAHIAVVFRDTALWLALPWHLEYSSAAKIHVHDDTLAAHAAVTRV